MNEIYLDHAATTYVKQEVLNEMLPYFSYKFGNASANYRLGQESKKAIEKARTQVAKAIGASAEEIYFTSGGSESDNTIINGFAKTSQNRGKHIITTRIEHKAVLNTCKALEEEGFEVTYLNVDRYGMIDLKELEKAIQNDTVLISVMFANNEIGTIEPIKEIGEIAQKHKVFFHTDAVQAIGNVKIDVNELNIDALSLSAHKFYGPKGVGALYIKKGFDFKPLIFGGHQENDKRAGTENVPGIVGLGKAIEIAHNNVDRYNEKLINLREYYIKKVFERIPNVKLNGHRTIRLPGSVSITFEGIEVGSLLLLLSEEGIYASGGSACNSSSPNPSHVLTAIGLDEKDAKSTLRVTFGEENTKEQVDYVVDKLERFVKRLRRK